MGVTRVVLHIDRLTLRGIAPAHREMFVTAFKLELARNLAETDVATRLAAQGSRAHLRTSMPTSGGTPGAAARALATELTK